MKVGIMPKSDLQGDDAPHEDERSRGRKSGKAECGME